jgi:hypothetical protein
MVRMSVLGDTLRTILNAERAGKRQVTISLIPGPRQTLFKGYNQIFKTHAKKK